MFTLVKAAKVLRAWSGFAKNNQETTFSDLGLIFILN